MLKTGRERRKETRLSQVSGLGSWEVSGVRVRDPKEKTLPLSLCPPSSSPPPPPHPVGRVERDCEDLCGVERFRKSSQAGLLISEARRQSDSSRRPEFQ